MNYGVKSLGTFGRCLKNKRNVENGSEIDVQQFYMHFKALSSEISVENDPICENFIDEFDKRTKGLNTLSTFDSLDVPFTTNEIRQAIKTLGKNKSCSTDNVIYEYFTEGIDVLDKPLVILLNYILEKQSFPKSWSKRVIIPIHKKGETSNPNNYRGITLISCFAKLFTSVINNRLKNWANEYDIISDAQFGFKSNFSTTDAIFILNSLIENQLNKKGSLFCCFIDLQKCFDSIYRGGLWYKLINQGLDGKLFKVISRYMIR